MMTGEIRVGDIFDDVRTKGSEWKVVEKRSEGVFVLERVGKSSTLRIHDRKVLNDGNRYRRSSGQT